MADAGRRQIVKYTFFKAAAEWRRLDPDERDTHRREFAAAVWDISERMFTRCFSLIGLRGDADFLLWQAADTPEEIQDAAAQLWSTRLGGYLTTPHSYLAMTRRSQYVGTHTHAGQEGTGTRQRFANRQTYRALTSICQSKASDGVKRQCQLAVESCV